MAFDPAYLFKGLKILKKLLGDSENEKVVEILKEQLNKAEVKILEQDKEILDLTRKLIRRGRK